MHLLTAYEIAAQAVPQGETNNVRVLLFTDVQPNVGATTPSEFEQMAANTAQQNIGLTVFALGLGLGPGPEILKSIAHTRGANAFALFDTEDVATFVADESPWFGAPIGYDLTFHTSASDAAQLQTADLAGEVQLSEMLLSLFRQHAPQGTLYQN